jgi:hypothetical protein
MERTINFECVNCLNIFDVEMKDIKMDKQRELHFTPEPECPRCGSIDEVYLSDFGQEQIDDMIFFQQLRPI